uniref:Vacuolar protein sorting-associated protein 16 homolog n=1 Tax=Odontella aurita TaxID=265563 RepID=A0A7S4JMZ7_9STRA|mmetsp:Transcript_4961/g.14201  ORF Transcript_4961/g.14201 Transcript_4961/m.14201 type:complete len:1207 (+) Transcript_4961:87-3707(+)
MPVGTNPFEDDRPSHRPVVSGNNPFDDDSDRGIGVTTNPFDDDAGGGGPVGFGIGGGDYGIATADDDDVGGEGDSRDDGDEDEDDLGSDAPVEASWQFLGDLPYRSVVLHDDVRWGQKKVTGDDVAEEDGDDNNLLGGFGLAAFPPQYLSAMSNRSSSNLLDDSDMRKLLQTATATKVAGCPNGGPIAAITLPVAGTSLPGFSATSDGGSGAAGGGGTKSRAKGGARGANSDSTAALSTTQLRILTASGRPLASVEFPPPSLAISHRRIYSASDVLTLGFTDRCVLVVVLRDSLILTYDLSGTPVLPPFHALPKGGTAAPGMSGPGLGGGSTGGTAGGMGPMGHELMEATVYGGGCAVLSTTMSCALVEILDRHDDPAYVDGAHIAARRVAPRGAGAKVGEDGGAGAADSSVGSDGDAGLAGGDPALGSARSSGLPRHLALVTPLPTSAHASHNYYSFCTLAVLPRQHTQSSHPEVFLSTSDNSVVVVDAMTADITDVDCRARINSPIVRMSFAPNGRFLACFTRGNVLTVISTSFETKVLDFDTSEGSGLAPADMKWCGEDSVVLYWKNLGVLMVGPYGDWSRHPYQNCENLYILPEIDCCRIVTDTSMELLQRVPPATAQLLRIGSIEPSAMLLDASDDFLRGEPSSDESARAITKTGMLEEAIEACTAAAVREFDIPTQKRLLMAASYGMHFAYRDVNDHRNVMGGPVSMNDDAEDEEDADGSLRPSPSAVCFVAASRKLRVLNALRDPAVGMTLTSAQFDAVTPPGIVARLVAMKRPALAGSIAKYLNLSTSVRAFARASRAAALVASDGGRTTDAACAEAAIKILNGDDSPDAEPAPPAANRGAFASVALAANRAGRPGVSNLLLLLETSVADKVPALLSVGSHADAAAVAASAGDSDLLFLALMELRRSCDAKAAAAAATGGGAAAKEVRGQFLSTVVTKFPPEAVNLLRQYYASDPDVKYAMNLLLRHQKFISAGTFMARRSLERPSAKGNKEKLSLLKEASRVFGLGKEGAFHKSSTDDYIELLSDQERLRVAYDSSDVAPQSSSVTSTIYSIVRFAGQRPREAHRLFSDAERLAKKFRVPEKRLWHVKVRAFAESGQWANLRNLADSRTKSPIGYKPFALAAIRGKQGVSEVMRYAERIASAEDRYDLFCEAGLWKRALEEATKLQDGRRIFHVRSLASASPDVQKLCDELVGRLAA